MVVIGWQDTEEGEWTAEWNEFSLRVRRDNETRWIWWLSYPEEDTKHLFDPAGEEETLEEAMRSAQRAVDEIIQRRSKP